jgi:hypothetical protein
MGCYGLDSSGLGQGPAEVSCERGNKPSGFIKCWETPEELSDWRFLKRGSGACYGVISQKVEFFIVIAVRTSNTTHVIEGT